MLGTRIASLRGQSGWSQAELARRLSISPSAVGMYEQGRREPSLEMLVALSREFGVSLEFLITGQTICREDQCAKAAMTGKTEEERSLMESLKGLSREELLVLLTAELIAAGEG